VLIEMPQVMIYAGITQLFGSFFLRK